MNIAILGYGKMGKMISQYVENETNDTIALIIDNTDDWKNKEAELKNCDVAIDFSEPAVAIDNIIACFKNKVPVVCGTTGWYDKLEYVKQMCEKYDGSLVYASNFSIGVNIFSEINKRLSKIMEKYAQYEVKVAETHHTAKLDKPSGTAITLANQIIENNATYSDWELTDDANTKNEHSIPVTSYREGNEVGTHEITWQSAEDLISIKHKAFSRLGFVKGALLSAKWILDKKGVFTVNDVVNS